MGGKRHADVGIIKWHRFLFCQEVRFFNFDEQASRAGRFAVGIKRLNNGLNGDAGPEGNDLEVDHMSAIASTGLAAEVQELDSALPNTTERISLL